MFYRLYISSGTTRRTCLIYCVIVFFVKIDGPGLFFSWCFPHSGTSFSRNFVLHGNITRTNVLCQEVLGHLFYESRNSVKLEGIVVGISSAGTSELSTRNK